MIASTKESLLQRLSQTRQTMQRQQLLKMLWRMNGDDETVEPTSKGTVHEK